MAKKASGKKNHPAEILDDNGTLIATSADEAGLGARGADDREAPADAPKNSFPAAITDKKDIPKP